MNINAPFSDSRTRFKAKARTYFAALFALSGLAYLWYWLFARNGVRILAYHGVETPPSSPFAVSIERFEEQVDYVSRHFDIIDFDRLLQWMDGRYQSDKPKIVLTFDDGFKNNLTHAAPILAKYGVPATFFIIGSKLEDDDPRFMKVKDARELTASPLFRIGSHSLNHLSMAKISNDEKKKEIGRSKSFLNATVDVKISCFCFPYGTYNDFDQQSVDVLRQYGYSLSCTSINGTNFRGSDRFRLRRTKVEWSDDLRTFTRLLHGALDAWILIDFLLRFFQKPRAVRFDDKPVQSSR